MGDRSDVKQGTLALMILKTLQLMGPLHGYGIARRIEQTSGQQLAINYGTIYPALLKLEQEGHISASWGVSDNNRKAKYLPADAGRAPAHRTGNARVGADVGHSRQVSVGRRTVVMRRARAWLRRMLVVHRPQPPRTGIQRRAGRTSRDARGRTTFALA